MNSRFEFILFDMIGTTIKDSNNGVSLIIANFTKAFSMNGFQVGYQEINHQRGKSKKEAIECIMKHHSSNSALNIKIYKDFMGLLNTSIEGLAEIDGATGIFKLLKDKEIKIGLGSGLPMEFMLVLIEKLGWQKDIFDYLGSSDELGKGRPDPIMILDAIEKNRLKDKSKILKVGDTIVDIQEGKNAGVKTAGVLTGTQKKEELEKFNPDYILNDIRELLLIL